MSSILYEFSYWKQTFVILPIIGILIILFTRFVIFFGTKFLVWLDSPYKKREFQTPKKWYKLNEFELWVIVLSTLIGLLPIGEYIIIANAYRNNTYQVVEGYVENFEPEKNPMKGTPPESFDINGTYFSYSEGIITCGYNRTWHNNGVIKNNGQHLKIGYVNIGGMHTKEGYKERNVIVYIEQLDDEVQ